MNLFFDNETNAPHNYRSYFIVLARHCVYPNILFEKCYVLRKDQVKQKIILITTRVGEELAQYKGTPSTPNKVIPGFGDDFSFELTKPYNVGHRFTAQEIYEKIKLAFAAQEMEDIPFEFGLATYNRGVVGYMERQSSNFVEWYEDEINHYSYAVAFIPPSGSAAENLANDEVLIVVVPKIGNIVTKDLLPQMIFSIVLLLVIITAFYITVSTMLRQKKLAR